MNKFPYIKGPKDAQSYSGFVAEDDTVTLDMSAFINDLYTQAIEKVDTLLLAFLKDHKNLEEVLELLRALGYTITPPQLLKTLPRKNNRLVMQDLLDLEYGYSDSARIYDVKDIQHVIDGPTFFVSGERTDFVTIAEVRDMYNKYADLHFTTELSLLADGVYHSIERIALLGLDVRQQEYGLVFSDSK